MRLAKKQLFPTLLPLAVVLFSTILTSTSQAAEAKGWAGGLLGLSVPSASGTTSRGTYGITAGAKVGSELGVGGYFLTSHKDEDASSVLAGSKADFGYDMYGVEVSYFFDGEAEGVYLGGRIGTTKVKAPGYVDGTAANYGAVAGFNQFLGDHFSIGGEVSFFSVDKANAINGFTMLNFLGSAKLWF